MTDSRFALVLVFVLAFCSRLLGGPVSTFDDISFWVGSGPRRAALTMDWQGQDDSSRSLVWGFRWSDTASPDVMADDMFTAVIREDPRLFAKVGDFGGLGLAVYGLGFDANGDGQFSLNDGTEFDSDGVALSGPADLGSSANDEDFYQEGWFLGYWHHGTSHETPESWATSGGLSNTPLTDGDWHSLAFTTDVLDQSAFATGLIAAETDLLTGDFDRNGVVGPSDFDLWRSTLGQSRLAAGYGADGNRDFTVDYRDLLVWQSHFGNTLPANLPEPASYEICLIGFLISLRRYLTSGTPQ